MCNNCAVVALDRMHASHATSLVYKGRVDLDKMLQDPMFTVVFRLTYELGQPMDDKDRRVGGCHGNHSLSTVLC